PNPPAWYYCVPALTALQTQDYELAVEFAERHAEADRELGPLLAIIAGQSMRNEDIVNRFLPRVLEVSSFRANGVLPQLRKRIGDKQLIDKVGEALIIAGLPEEALEQAF